MSQERRSAISAEEATWACESSLDSFFACGRRRRRSCIRCLNLVVTPRVERMRTFDGFLEVFIVGDGISSAVAEGMKDEKIC